jgi:hypothetical protein
VHVEPSRKRAFVPPFRKKKSTKYDLRANAPFWSKQGGQGGNQACVESCPVKALKLVKEAPSKWMLPAATSIWLRRPMAKIPPKPVPKQN